MEKVCLINYLIDYTNHYYSYENREDRCKTIYLTHRLHMC